MKKRTISIVATLMIIVALSSMLMMNSSAVLSQNQAIDGGFDVWTAYNIINYSSYRYNIDTYESPGNAVYLDYVNDPWFTALLAGWEGFTFDFKQLGQAVAQRDVAYYETVFWGVLYDEDKQSLSSEFLSEYSSTIKDAKKLTDKLLGTSVLKKITKNYSIEGSDWMYITPDAGGPDFEALMQTIEMCDELKPVVKVLGEIRDYADYFRKGLDFVNGLIKVASLLNDTQEVYDVFQAIYSTCPSNLASLKLALQEFSEFTDPASIKELAISVFVGNKTTDIAVTEFAKVAWDALLTKLGALGVGVGVGQAVGKWLDDVLFETSDYVTAFYKMSAIYYLEQVVKAQVVKYENAFNSNPSLENAKRFNFAVKMLYKVYIASLDAYKEFYTKAYRGGIVGNTFKPVSDEEFNKVIKDLENIKSSLKISLVYGSESAYDLYQELVSEMDPWLEDYLPTVPVEYTNEEYRQNLDLLEETVPGFQRYINGNWKLTDDVTLYGGATMVSGTLDLNGHTLTIEGAFIQKDGTVVIGNGTLNVMGDYRIQTPQVDGNGNLIYNSAQAFLQMESDAGAVNVAGDFYTYSAHTGTNWNKYTAGVMTIKGDFYQYGGDSFAASGTHKVIFDGAGIHRVYFERTGSYFKKVEAKNNAELIFENYVTLNPLEQNLTIKLGKEAIVNYITLNGYTLTIEGDFVQTQGRVTVGSGTLNVKGDYRIQTPQVDGNGNLIYNSAQAFLQMESDAGAVNVAGDFYTYSAHTGTNWNKYTAGVMTIKGDFYQHGGDSFAASGTHKVIFDGAGEHLISFASSSSHFAQLGSTWGATLKWIGYMTFLALAGDVVIDNTEAFLLGTVDLGEHNLTFQKSLNLTNSGTFYLNKGTLTVNGDLLQQNGTIVCEDGTLHVIGDYRMQTPTYDRRGELNGYSASQGVLTMEYADGQVIVDGDFYMQSSKSTSNKFTAGTMTLHGDLYVLASRVYVSSGTHKLILAGSGDQTLSVSASYGTEIKQLEALNPDNRVIIIDGSITLPELNGGITHFKSNGSTLSMKKAAGDMVIDGDVILSIEDTANGSIIINGDLTNNGDITLSGHDMTVNGDFNLVKGTLDLNGSTLTISGTIKQSASTVNINKGTLDIGRNYYIAAFTSSGAMSATAANLIMINDEDVVKVEKDFVMYSSFSHAEQLTAGTMYIGGDFEQKAGESRNFYCSGTHTVVLNGIGPKSVIFATYPRSQFNNLILGQSASRYSFVPAECWEHLHDFTNYVSDNNATCTKDGTKTAVCNNGCGKTDTILDVGSALGHTDPNENGKCSRCGVLLIVTHTPGDINGDGALNNKDLNRLMKHLAGDDVEVVEAALDLNDDGNVNNKDLNRLMKYLAGEDVEIY